MAHPVLIITGLLLVAATLRAPFTAVAPILGELQSTLALSPAEAGLLTTLPLLAFGLISPFAAGFARTIGLERSLLGALLLVMAGVAIRSIGPAWCVYAGTCGVGAGIAVGNVLLPSLVKRDFPAHVSLVTGACVLAMGGAAAAASACIVPLASAWGWQAALGSSAAFPLMAAVVWMTQLGSRTEPTQDTATVPHGNVWRSALAWQITLFMGINSLLYYVLVGWLPSMLVSEGFSETAAGSLHGVMQLASALPGLMLAPIVNRMKEQIWIAAITGVAIAMALLGFRVAPQWAMVWTFLFGVGAGNGILLALIFLSLRARNAHEAAALSGMAQCVGYLVAAGGPALAGALHDLTGSWDVLLELGAALAIAMAVLGALAGRPYQLSTRCAVSSAG
jgi:CP family cyanate transporter-like MFS transporter